LAAKLSRTSVRITKSTIPNTCPDPSGEPKIAAAAEHGAARREDGAPATGGLK
jgi:hypothetical protein